MKWAYTARQAKEDETEKGTPFPTFQKEAEETPSGTEQLKTVGSIYAELWATIGAEVASSLLTFRE